jgi:hypothetical protein
MAVAADAQSVQPTFIVHNEEVMDFYIDAPHDLANPPQD